MRVVKSSKKKNKPIASSQPCRRGPPAGSSIWSSEALKRPLPPSALESSVLSRTRFRHAIWRAPNVRVQRARNEIMDESWPKASSKSTNQKKKRAPRPLIDHSLICLEHDVNGDLHFIHFPSHGRDAGGQRLNLPPQVRYFAPEANRVALFLLPIQGRQARLMAGRFGHQGIFVVVVLW